jgi:hypothetical protein
MRRHKNDAVERVHQDPEKDPMSGYASADVMDATPEDELQPETAHADEEKDPMSGYASADELERDRESD